jgi:hypothetical protein
MLFFDNLIIRLWVKNRISSKNGTFKHNAKFFLFLRNINISRFLETQVDPQGPTTGLYYEPGYIDQV